MNKKVVYTEVIVWFIIWKSIDIFLGYYTNTLQFIPILYFSAVIVVFILQIIFWLKLYFYIVYWFKSTVLYQRYLKPTSQEQDVMNEFRKTQHFKIEEEKEIMENNLDDKN